MMQPIPLSFIRSKTRLSWKEAAFGYHNNWLGWIDARELATDHLIAGDNSADVFELASITESNSNNVDVLLDKLSRNTVMSDDSTTKAKWLYIILAWLYENRVKYVDPLQEAEIIYADFGYPQDMAHFIYYMPAVNPDEASLYSTAENQSRLLKEWKSYLDRMSAIFSGNNA